MASILDTINKAVGYTGTFNTTGKVYTSGAPKAPTNVAPNIIGNAGTDWEKLKAEIMASLSGMRTPAAPTAIAYDFAGANARARAAAEAAVNPLYTQKLNTLLTDVATKRNRASEDAATANTEIETALQNALDSSNISRERTTQDTETRLGDIAANTANFQTQDGANFDNERTSLLGAIAASGLTGSGIGAQRVQNAQDTRNYNSGLKMTDFSNQKERTQLASDRTFEDLARADTLSTQASGQQKSKVTVDLNRAMEDIGSYETSSRNQLEAQRLSDVLNNQLAQQKLLGQQWLQSLQGKVSAGQYTATAQSLAGLF